MKFAHAFKTGGGRRLAYGLHHMLSSVAENKSRTFLLIKSRLLRLYLTLLGFALQSALKPE